METILIEINRQDVLAEVAKATDYTGAKMLDADDGAYARVLAADEDLADLGRFWSEAAGAMNERLKSMFINGSETPTSYVATLEVSRSFDKGLTQSVASALRSYFIASIVGKWFKFANKDEAADYQLQAAALLDDAERLLYSRKRPMVPAG